MTTLQPDRGCNPPRYGKWLVWACRCKWQTYFLSVTVIRRDKEIDVAAGDVRMVILIQEKGHQQFLWPVLRQKPMDSNATGILGGWKGWDCLNDLISGQPYVELMFAPNCAGWCGNNSLKDTHIEVPALFLVSVCSALKPAVYEEVPQTPLTKLKISNQETDVTRYVLFCLISWYKKREPFESILINITLIYKDIWLFMCFLL